MVDCRRQNIGNRCKDFLRKNLFHGGGGYKRGRKPCSTCPPSRKRSNRRYKCGRECRIPAGYCTQDSTDAQGRVPPRRTPIICCWSLSVALPFFLRTQLRKIDKRKAQQGLDTGCPITSDSSIARHSRLPGSCHAGLCADGVRGALSPHGRSRSDDCLYIYK